MAHNISLNGFSYRLRPVNIKDAEFIVDLRTIDADRNKYINITSTDANLQKKWILEYQTRNNDYYFVIENILDSSQEGVIAIYDVNDNKAEWGRWVLKKSSLASIESVDLIFKVAFDILKLDEVYCRTIKDNSAVVSFHDSLLMMRRETTDKKIKLNDKSYDFIEHYVTKTSYKEELQINLESKNSAVFQRNFRQLFGNLEFHHIGIATRDIEKEFLSYRILGYSRESMEFKDDLQGVKGLFIVARNQPRLELLENLPNSNTLDFWLKNRIKAYHFAYKASNIDDIIKSFNKNKIKVISQPKYSSFFKKRICFLALSNMFLIELIEND